MAIGASEAEPFWTAFLRDLVRRGLGGVKLVVSDAHEGIRAATARVLSTTWQRCRVHFQRNAPKKRKTQNTKRNRRPPGTLGSGPPCPARLGPPGGYP